MRMQKKLIKTRVISLLACVVTLQVNAGIFDACFGGGEYKPISEQKLQARMSKIPKSMGVCFNAALCLSKAERLLTQAEEDLVVSTTHEVGAKTSYTKRFQEVMNIDDDSHMYTSLNNANAANNLNLADINESGFLNFKRLKAKGEGLPADFFHTAYIQVTADGEKFLYNANHSPMDVAIMQAGHKDIIQVGDSLRYKMDEITVTGFNNFLKNVKEGESGFFFTPASQVAENASHTVHIT
ncbi:hypothetical protein SG34_029660 [Thalassomonas viridans]|uniref:DUF8038 domain-containing protein n=1 Tax=Thalassomonas viridans TaxID=137584 RepID=A0AAF0CD69_9GAMM|nr:hypothetical protein [Thalassomonas viridans]WDE08908.1 hypothetical protein SG34_034025 [Thalassomonas viridans]WDE08955.1 hypothetical protein SG34_029660 [Thalassomonas viridans]